MTWAPPPRLLDVAPPARLVLFDIDGTLLVASNLHREAFFVALKEFFDVRPLQAWKDYAGRTDPWILKDMLRLAGKDPALLDPVMAVVQRFMVDFYARNVDKEKTTVVPGVQHLLSLLDASGIMRGLVTGNLEPIAFLKLQSAGLAQGFATGGFGSDHEDRSRLIEIAIERATRVHGFTFTGKNVIYIGDTPRDVVAARQAGVPAAVMRTVINASEDFTGAEPDVFVDPGNPEPFIKFIEKL